MAPTVLIVEDDASLRDILCATLIDEGLAAEAVTDGSAALDCIRHQPPSLILLDLNLPDIDGREVFTRLRAMGVQAPAIFMTGWQWARQEAAQFGADGFIAKPFDFDDLLDLVHRYL